MKYTRELEARFAEFDKHIALQTSADAFRELDMIRREMEERRDLSLSEPERIFLTDVLAGLDKRISEVSKKRAEEVWKILSAALGDIAKRSDK